MLAFFLSHFALRGARRCRLFFPLGLLTLCALCVTAQADPTPLAQIAAGSSSAIGSFSADTDYDGGGAGFNGDTIDTSGATGAAPQGVYQSERYGNFTYTVPGLTAGQPCVVRLHFAEIYWDSAGQRLFNVTVNGSQALTDFDIIAEAGGKDRAITRDISTTANASGDVVIAFQSVTDNAKVSGIEVFGTSPPSSPAGLSAVAGTNQVSLNWSAPTGSSVTGYNVYQGTAAGGENPAPVLSNVRGTFATVTGLPDGTPVPAALTPQTTK